MSTAHSAGVMRVFIDSMMIRTFSSGARCGFFIDKSTPEGVKFVTLEVFSFYGVHSNIDNNGERIRVTHKGWLDKKVWREINDILNLYGFEWDSNDGRGFWIKYVTVTQ